MSRCAGPRISASGVRSSWLTLAKNCVLISSSSRMRSSSPCSSMFFCAISRSCAFFSVMSRPSAQMNTTLPCVVHHRHQRGVDDDRHRAVGAGVERRVPADELALRGAGDGVPDALVGLFRDLPPERGPERLALDVGQLDADRVERHFVDLDDRSLGIEQTDELHHRVERDPRDLLAVALAGGSVETISVPRTTIGCSVLPRGMRIEFFSPLHALSTGAAIEVRLPSMAIVVQKYGGSSVADVKKLRLVAERVMRTRRLGHNVVVVVSAMGDTTDELLAMAKQASSTPIAGSSTCCSARASASRWRCCRSRYASSAATPSALRAASRASSRTIATSMRASSR